MYLNYIKLALRNLRNRFGYSLINILGLAIGLSCVMIIASYVKLETSFDKFHTKHEQIYRVVMDWDNDGEKISTAMVHAPLADNIANSITGIESIVRVYPHFQSVYIGKSASEKTKVEQFLFADSTFFQIFDFSSIRGSLTTALKEPFSVVLSRKMAVQLFGRIDIIGLPLTYEDESAELHTFNITTVIEDVPQNSHFHFDILASFSSMKTVVPYYNNWFHPPLYTYLLISPSADKSSLEAQVDEIANNAVAEISGGGTDKRIYHLQNLADIHLNSSLEDEWEANSDATFINILIMLAGFILLIACINFMNLATVQSSRRAKEIGMRKVMGALKKQLIFQFLWESFIITLIAFALALAFSELALIYVFNNIIDRTLSLSFLFALNNIFYTAIVLVMVSLLAGLYPAVYLSKFMPIVILRGHDGSKSGRSFSFKRLMVVFQFFVAAVLMLGTLIVMRQTHLMRNKNLGFDKDYIISLKMVDDFAHKNYSVLKEKLLANSSITNVGLSSTLPGGSGFYGLTVKPEGRQESMTLKTLGVDEGFLDTYGINLVEGRNFSEAITTDLKEAVIINKAAAKQLSWLDPLGKEMSMTIYFNGPETRKMKVIGVVEDFHYQSLYNDVDPLIIYINKHEYYSDYLSVKFTGTGMDDAVATLEREWKNFHPDKAMDFAFLDTTLENIYATEQKRSQIFTSFAILSIIISCLGLFGLSAYSIQQRTREIGIRKVLGASMLSVSKMLLKEYMILILVANILACPLVFYFGNQWLNGFAFHIDLTIWMFLVVFITAVLIALATIGYQAIGAARANPVDALKDE